MTNFTDNLWRDLVREHGATLTHADRPDPTRMDRAAILRRPRMLAGGTLGLAGVGAALVVALSAGGATAPPAFAITTHSDGTVLVSLSRQEDLGQANQKLAAMGTGEQITLYDRPTPAADNSPVTCTPGPGAGAPNPPIKVTVVGRNGDNTGYNSRMACIVGAHTYDIPYPGG